MTREIFHTQFLSPHSDQGGQSLEKTLPERPTHSVEAYIADNRSQLTQDNLTSHEEFHNRGALVYNAECGDARQDELKAGQSLVDRRIAAGILPEKARKPFEHPSVQFGAIRPHYAGSTAVPGESPKGCGGHKAVESLRHKHEQTDDALLKYAETRIAHTDPIIHGLKLARRLARTSEAGKPVILMPYDHETGRSKVVAYYERRGNVMLDITPWDFHMPLDGQYDPAQVYAKGVPDIDRSVLPEYIQQYLADYDSELAKKPVLPQEQETQDPGAIMFTTELRDSKLWLPNTYTKPNAGFRLSLYHDEQRHVSHDDQDIALAQARFVLRQSVANAFLPGTEFHSTKTAVVMTDQYDLSRTFAARFVQATLELGAYDKTPSWFDLPDRHLIIGEVHNGKIQRIGEVDVAVKDGRAIKFDEKEVKM